MTRKPRRAVRKGWTFVERLPAGLGNLPCHPFFSRRYMAEAIAKAWSHRKLTIVPATLTLSPPKRKRARP